MNERRKDTEHLTNIRLLISDLFHYEQHGIRDLDTSVKVEHISRRGLSFVSECAIPAGYYFHADLDFEYNQDSPVPVTLKIIRVEIVDRIHCRYECEFVDLSDDIRKQIEQIILTTSNICI